MAEDPCVQYLNLDTNYKYTNPINEYENGNLSFDDCYDRRGIYHRPYVTNKPGKVGKAANSLVMRRVRRSRTIFTNDQITELKNFFMQNNYVNTARAEKLAAKLSIEPTPVRIWFKNQRRKLKIKEVEKQLIDPRQYAPHNSYIPTLTPPPTSSPSLSDVDIKLEYNPMYHDYNNIKHENAYQWLQHQSTVTPSQMAYNSSNPEIVPQLKSFHEAVVNFNRLPYTLPSPASTTSGDGNSITFNSDTSDYFSQMSPNSENIDPLTPKSANGDAESVFNDILDSLKTPKTDPRIQTVFEKMTSDAELKIKPEFDTIPILYENYEISTPSSEQLHCLELV